MKRKLNFVVEADRYGVSHGWDRNLVYRQTIHSYRFTLPLYPQHAITWRRYFHNQTTIEVDVVEFDDLPAIFKAVVLLT